MLTLLSSFAADEANDKAIISMELFLKCVLSLLLFQMEMSSPVIVTTLRHCVAWSKQQVCGVGGASCLTQSAGDTWNAKSIARGVQTERAMGNTSKRSEVKLYEEGQFSIELVTKDLLTRSTHSYSVENKTSVRLQFQMRLFY